MSSFTHDEKLELKPAGLAGVRTSSQASAEFFQLWLSFGFEKHQIVKLSFKPLINILNITEFSNLTFKGPKQICRHGEKSRTGDTQIS